MDHITPDELIDRIEITWVPGSEQQYTTADVPEMDGARMLRGFLSRGHWMGLLFLAEGVLEHAGRDVNDSGFRYGDDEDDVVFGDDDYVADDDDHEDDDEDEGDGDAPAVVEVYNPFESVAMTEAAFVRMMARLFTTIVDGATADGNAVTQADWWPRFVEVAAEVAARAEG